VTQLNLALVFGQPFVKWFALCYWTLVCLSCLCLSVTLVYCGQTVGWIKMKLGMEVGLRPGHIVLDGTQLTPPPKGAQHPQFSAHVCCGQTAGCIKMPLGMEVRPMLSDRCLSVLCLSVLSVCLPSTDNAATSADHIWRSGSCCHWSVDVKLTAKTST